MEVVSLSPLRAASLIWRSRDGSPVLTVVSRATFDLVPIESRLAERQEHPSDEDNHWNDDPARSVYAPSDLVPFKPRADVMLVGHAFAPRGEPVRSLVARLLVGEIDKSIEIYRERTWTRDGGLREGARFAKMPLRYERAAGGPDTSNPVGMRSDATDAYGGTLVPNLQPPGLALTSPSDFIEPVGFGPIAPSWRSRVEKLGRHASTWSASRWVERALPEDIDPGFFNAAPRDQQVTELRDNERLLLEHLHPQHARLVTSLPGIRPRAFADRPTMAPHEITMVCDTLWIDTDRALCTLTWRGQIELQDIAQPGRVLVAMEEGSRLSWDDVERLARNASRAHTPSRQPAVPRAGTDTINAEDTSTESFPAVPAFESALPFRAPEGPVAPPNDQSADRARESGAAGSRASPTDASGATASDVVAVDASPPWMQPGRSSPPPHPSSVPPRAMPAPVPSSPPPREISPWASGVASAPRTAGTERTSSSVRNPAVAAPVVLPSVPPASAAYEGAVAASNAAAARAAVPPSSKVPVTRGAGQSSPPRPPPDVVELLWFDPAAAPRARACFSEIAADLEFEPPDARHDVPADDPAKASERHLVFGILTEAPRLASTEVGNVLAASVSPAGRFTPPLCVVAGELRLPFDELETLKASIALVSPLVATDAKLKKELDGISELVSSPSIERSAGVVEKLTQHVRGLFTQARTALPAHYLDTHVERILLEGRHHQRRSVFGAPHIRGLVGVPGEPPTLPAYLPEPLLQKMPLAANLRVRLLAEAHFSQDVYEPHPAALRILALGRILSLEGIRGRDK